MMRAFVLPRSKPAQTCMADRRCDRAASARQAVAQTIACVCAAVLLGACATPPRPAAAGIGSAGAPSAIEAPPAEAQPDDGTRRAQSEEPSPRGIDRTPAIVREMVVQLARGIDRWFGDRPFEEGGQVTDGRLRVFASRRQDAEWDANLTLNARVRLPNVERRAYLIVGRDNEREGVAGRPAEVADRDRLLGERPEDRSFFAGLGVTLRDAVDLRAGFRGVKPYAQALFRRQRAAGETGLVEFRQTVFWKLDDGFGSTTALAYGYAWSRTLLLRLASSATITQQSGRFEWSSAAGVHKAFAGDRLLSLEMLGIGQQHTGVTFSDYGLQAKWLQPVHQDWLFAEFVGGHFWPRADASRPRGRAWAFGAGVIVQF